MKDPKNIEIVKEGATYKVPTYEVTNNGIVDSIVSEIKFCKGSKDDDNIYRQSGYFTETLLYLIQVQLESVNVGKLKSEETTEAIRLLETAQLSLMKRTLDRNKRNVLSTYKS